MCNPLAIFAVGTLMKMQAQRQANKRTNAEIDKAETRQDAYARQLTDQLDRSEKQYDPTQRQATQDQAQQQAQDNMAQTIGQTRTEGRGDYIPTSGGNVGRTYNVEAAERTLDTANRASTIAAMLAKLRAPNDLRTTEGYTDADAGGNMASVARQQVAMGRAGAQDIQSASVPNPFLTMIGSGMQAYGSYGMAGGTDSGPKPVAQSEHGPVYQGSHGPYIPRNSYRG